MALPTQEEFEHILRSLLSAENEPRRQAEAHFEACKANPGWLVGALMHLLANSPDDALRQMCAVLLRRQLAKSNDLYSKLPADQKQNVRQQLLQLLQSESRDNKVRRSLAHCISQLGSHLVEAGEWPELLPFLFTCVRDGEPPAKQSALMIFSQLATHLADAVLLVHLQTLKDAFAWTLREQEPISVRVAAVDALANLALVVEEDAHIATLSPLTMPTLATLAAALNGNQEEFVVSTLEQLITVAEGTPSFFLPNLSDCFSAMLQVASSPVADNIRQLAVEFVLSYAEADSRHTKKMPQVVEHLLPLALQWMLTVSDDPAWGSTNEDDGEVTNHDVGGETLDRLALALGGKLVEPVATRHIAQYLQSGEWRSRYAGLMALAQIAEGCKKQLEGKLGTVVHMVLKHLQPGSSEHERVRWAAVHCTAQFANDFAPGFQKTFHSAVIPALLASLTDPVPKVVQHAATSIVNFLDEATGEDIAPYADEMVTKLLIVLHNSSVRFVNEQAISAISSIADTMEQDFVKYYDSVMPYLKTVLAHAGDKSHRMMRAKAMEAVSLIAMSVGKQKFSGDAMEVMKLLQMTQESHMEEDDPQASYLLQAWGRIAKCLENDFIPYLPGVIPPLLQQASVETDVTVSDVDEGETVDPEEGVETIVLAIKGVGDKMLTFKTAVMQDKSLACQMIQSYLEDIPQGLGGYLQNIATIVVPLLRFPYLGEIRATCCGTLPLLMDAVEKCNMDAGLLITMVHEFCGQLIEAVKLESDVAVAAAMMESFHKCISKVPTDTINTDEIGNWTPVLKQVFEESLRRRKVLHEQAKELADDEDEVEKLEEEDEGEEELLTQAVEVVGTLVKTTACFLPRFLEHFFPMCAELLGDSYGHPEHRLALCVMDDFVEHGTKQSKEAVHPHLQNIIQAQLRYASCEDPDVRQAAVYGLGVSAQFGPEVFHQVVQEATRLLVAAVQSPHAKEEEHVSATANAVSSLIKVLQYHSTHASGVATEANLIPVILQALPIQGDEIEARFVHRRVMEWVVQGHPIVLGENKRNMAAIVGLCEVIVSVDANNELVDAETKEQMRTLLQQNGK